MKNILSTKKSKIIFFSIIAVVLVLVATVVCVAVSNKNKVYTMKELILQEDVTGMKDIEQMNIYHGTKQQVGGNINLDIYLNSTDKKETFNEILDLLESTKCKKVRYNWLGEFRDTEKAPIGSPFKNTRNFTLTSNDGHRLGIRFIRDRSGFIRSFALPEGSKKDFSDDRFYWEFVNKEDEAKLIALLEKTAPEKMPNINE